MVDFDADYAQVIWSRLYNAASQQDGGTLYQLRNLINRRNIKKDPSKDVAASEDFFLLITEAHVLSAFMSVIGMAAIDSSPHSEYFPDGCTELNTSQRCKILLSCTRQIVNKFVDLSYCEKLNVNKQYDHVYAYASEILTLGLLLMEFEDSIKEGDGLRIIRCWRYFLLLFKSTKHVNYAIEAFNLLMQCDVMLSPRMAMQLIWSRTVNTHGQAGRSIPCDLHMEHMNRIVKVSMKGLGSNITQKAIERVGKSYNDTQKVVTSFDQDSNISQHSSLHKLRTVEKDMGLLLRQLNEVSQVFSTVPGRHHSKFKNFQQNIMNNVDLDSVIEWMNKRCIQIFRYF
jgi:hypothetical protein